MTTLKTVAKEALTFNGIDVKLLVYFVGIAFLVYFFFMGQINASEEKMTQTIKEVAADNRLATERISVDFQLFVLRKERNDLLTIKEPGAIERQVLADTVGQIQRLEARQRELDRLELERQTATKQ